MALFVDGNITSLQDLKAHETSILDMASSEGIDLGSKLTLAQDELAIELSDFLRCNGDGRIGVELENVTLTAALRRWHCLHTLALTFRDAYHNQLNDRYRGKYECYTALAQDAAQRVFAGGVGMAATPVHATDPDVAAEDQEPEYRVTANRRLRRG